MIRNQLLTAVSIAATLLPAFAAGQQSEEPQPASKERSAAELAAQQILRKQAQHDYQDVNARYAEAVSHLAHLELEDGLEMNKRIPGSVASIELERLRNGARIAENQLSQALDYKRSDKSPINLRLEQAEAAAKLAESRYQRALEAQRTAAGAVRNIDVDRLRLRAEVARLAAEREKANERLEATKPADLIAELEQLKLEIAQLREQVESLTHAHLAREPSGGQNRSGEPTRSTSVP